MPCDNTSAKRVVLRCHPEGHVKVTDFAVEPAAVPDLTDGTFLVRNLFVSVDPMLRIFIDRSPLGNIGIPALPPGTVIPGAAVGEVVESRHPDFTPGDVVEGRFGWQHFAISGGQGVVHVPAGLGGLENALGIGGLPGFTAYIGLHVAGGVKPGQTVLVSGAAGAVGSAVGTLVKARGGRVVGIAGGAHKRRYLLEHVGYDAVADRYSPDFHALLAAALPGGANVYFDNVGGPMLAGVTRYMAYGGVVLISGLMAQYQGDAAGGQPDDLATVLYAVMGKGLRIEGFSQFGQDSLRPAFQREIAELITSGAIKPQVHIIDGLENLPKAQVDLFDNSTTGKVVVRVAPAPASRN